MLDLPTPIHAGVLPLDISPSQADIPHGAQLTANFLLINNIERTENTSLPLGAYLEFLLHRPDAAPGDSTVPPGQKYLVMQNLQSVSVYSATGTVVSVGQIGDQTLPPGPR